MKYNIYDKSGRELAVMDVDDNGFYHVEFKDGQFESFLKDKISRGINVFDEKHYGNIFVATIGTLSAEGNMGYAILEFLRYNGYAVDKDTGDIKKEIETMLASFPEDDSKKDILSELPDLNYLEATLLLRDLKTD